MKPRVSRSSVLVSMATGFPIAKIAIGYLLDELNNDITRETPARPVREFAVLCWKSEAMTLSRGKLRAEH